MVAVDGVPGTEVSAAEFRHAMGHFATGVTVITSIGADGRPVGTTASAVAREVADASCPMRGGPITNPAHPQADTRAIVAPGLRPGRRPAALNTLDPNSRRGFFLYGGYGDARPVSPKGLRFSALYGGRSMLAGSDKVELAQDDFVFMRPTESEGVLLQFGDIAVYDGQEIGAWWPTFRIHA